MILYVILTYFKRLNKKILSIADRGYVLATGENKIDDTGLNLLTNPDVGMLYLGGSN